MTEHAIADYMDRPCPAVLIAGEYICMHEWERTRETIPYVAWGGHVRHLPVTFDLGHTAAPPAGQRAQYGLRRALYDAAYGHVNGYPASAILYFVLTRSLNDIICKRVLAWEAKRRTAAEDPDGSGRESAAERHTRNLAGQEPRP